MVNINGKVISNVICRIILTGLYSCILLIIELLLIMFLRLELLQM
jgi:hypothetical protein